MNKLLERLFKKNREAKPAVKLVEDLSGSYRPEDNVCCWVVELEDGRWCSDLAVGGLSSDPAERKREYTEFAERRALDPNAEWRAADQGPYGRDYSPWTEHERQMKALKSQMEALRAMLRCA